MIFRLYLIPTIFLSFLVLTSCKKEQNQKHHPIYKELINAYNENRDLEEKVFNKLVFTLSDFQFKKSLMLKLIMEDQFGRKWMFKIGKEARDGAVAMYHLFKYFGLKTPEIHYKTFLINEKSVEGTLQRFITNQGNLMRKYPFALMTSSAWQYLVNNHIFSWLAGNYHVHPGQFIITQKDNGYISELMRVDNSVEWFLIGQDRLQIDYESPTLNSVRYGGYLGLWTIFFMDLISIDLNESFKLVQFISDFPNKEYKEVFLRGVENNFKYFANMGTKTLAFAYKHHWNQAKKDSFLNLILKRKKNAPGKFSRFYKQLVKHNEEQQTKYKSKRFDVATKDHNTVGRKIIEGLKEENKRLQTEWELVSKQKEVQKNIDAITSFDAYLLLRSFFWLSAAKKERHVMAVVDEVLNKLKLLKQKTHNPYEKKAILQAMSYLKKQGRSGKKDHLVYRKQLLNLNKVFSIKPRK